MAGAIYSEAQESIARAFTAARRKAGMKQAELATAIGKRQSYISDIERGQRRIDVLEAYVIARALSQDPIAFYAALIDGVTPDAKL